MTNYPSEGGAVFAFDRDETVEVNPHPDHESVRDEDVEGVDPDGTLDPDRP